MDRDEPFAAVRGILIGLVIACSAWACIGLALLNVVSGGR